MMRLVLNALLLLLLGCTHLVLESTERLQIRNLSDSAIRNFSVAGRSDTLVWIPEEVAPGDLSYVHERDFVGSFHIVFEAKSGGRWIPVELGKVRFDGGSELAKISRKDSIWVLDFE